MEIETLKKNIGVLLLNDLESLGVDVDSNEVKLYTTTDDYCNEKLESTWVASINNNQKLMFIANGILYDKETAHTLNKNAEVARIFVDEPKAEMLIDALFHAYPELICRKIEELDEEEFLFEHQSEDFEEDSIDEEDFEIDEKIGELRARIVTLKKLKKELSLKTTKPNDDTCIDLYKRIKTFAETFKDKKAKKLTIIKRKNSCIFISRFNKVVKIVQADIKNIVREGTEQLPISEITKTILLEKKTIKALLSIIGK